MAEHNVPIWLIQSGFGMGGVIVGAAMAWGILKEKVRHMEEKIKGHEDRLKALEQKDPIFVVRPDCFQFRQQCHTDLSSRFVELKEEIGKNREIVTEKLQEISEFIGYVRGQLEKK